ncbi:MAG: hypothetical protein AABO58_21145 [Acidobacteriota bacterium]
MHAFLIAVALFAQTDVSVDRQAVKAHPELHAALAPSAIEKLERAAASIAKVDVKSAQKAVKTAFPDAELSAADIDALASYVMSEAADIIAAETTKIDEQKRAVQEAMKAAGLEPKVGAKYALKLSGDYAKAPEPLGADAAPAAMQQRLEELGAMAELNQRRRTSVLDAADAARKKGHDVALNAIRNLK